MAPIGHPLGFCQNVHRQRLANIALVKRGIEHPNGTLIYNEKEQGATCQEMQKEPHVHTLKDLHKRSLFVHLEKK